MTNPKHTDTSRSGDLVAAMKDQIESWEFEDPRETWWKWQHQYAQAADRIEALEAEVERLRDDSWFDQFEEQEQLRDNAEQRLSVVEAEIKPLREAATALRDDMVNRAKMNAWQNDGEIVVEAGAGVWARFCAALGETQ